MMALLANGLRPERPIQLELYDLVLVQDALLGNLPAY
jgi:hypothetical protein